MSRPTDEAEEPFDLLDPLDDAAGPARPLSAEQSSALVGRALAATFAPVSPAQSPTGPRPPPAPRLLGRGPLWVGTAVVVGAVAAGVAWRMRAPAPQLEPTPRAAEVRPTPPAPPLPEPAPPPSPVTSETPAPAPSPAQEVKGPARPAAEPEDLLRRANERRAAGQWQAAESLYLRVIQSSPGTESAYVALVASGGLRAEQLGDARGALRQYQQALRLRPRGALSEEAHFGVAKAWRALGDTAQEARALEEFLTAHPDSLRAAPARNRLQQLSAPPP